MTKIRINDGDYAGYLRETLGSQGTKAGGATMGSPILNEAQAAVAYRYVPPTPPVVPPSGYKHYKVYLSPLAPRAYVGEVYFSLADPYDAGQLVVPVSVTVPTEGGNMQPGSILIDGDGGTWWSGPTAAESGFGGTFLCFSFSQAYPVRCIRVKLGGGGPSFSYVDVEKSNSENAWGASPYFNGKPTVSQGAVEPTWIAMPNGYADLSVTPA